MKENMEEEFKEQDSELDDEMESQDAFDKRIKYCQLDKRINFDQIPEFERIRIKETSLTLENWNFEEESNERTMIVFKELMERMRRNGKEFLGNGKKFQPVFHRIMYIINKWSQDIERREYQIQVRERENTKISEKESQEERAKIDHDLKTIKACARDLVLTIVEVSSKEIEEDTESHFVT